MNKKVYIFLADGFEEIEALTVVDLLRRAGIEVCMVSVTLSLDVTGSHRIPVKADLLFADTDYADADLLVLPGGQPGTRSLEAYRPLTDLLKKFYAEEKKLAAICAAPGVFARLGFLKGRLATSYPGVMPALEENGAVLTEDCVAVSDFITTSRGLGTAIDFSLSLIETLIDPAKAEEIAASVVYKR